LQPVVFVRAASRTVAPTIAGAATVFEPVVLPTAGRSGGGAVVVEGEVVVAGAVVVVGEVVVVVGAVVAVGVVVVAGEVVVVGAVVGGAVVVAGEVVVVDPSSQTATPPWLEQVPE
jgi:hypothetical protein